MNFKKIDSKYQLYLKLLELKKENIKWIREEEDKFIIDFDNFKVEFPLNNFKEEIEKFKSNYFI